MYAGANWESRDLATGRTPIHAAAANNHEDALKVMVLVANSQLEPGRANRAYEAYDETKGASSFYNLKLANLKDSTGRTPLMLAVENGYLNTVVFLVSQMGANVLATDDSGRTALHRAVRTLSLNLILHKHGSLVRST